MKQGKIFEIKPGDLQKQLNFLILNLIQYDIQVIFF